MLASVRRIVHTHARLYNRCFLPVVFCTRKSSSGGLELGESTVVVGTCSCSTIQGSTSKAVVCQSNVTALLREAALFIPCYERTPSVPPNDFDRLVSAHRLIGGPLLYEVHYHTNGIAGNTKCTGLLRISFTCGYYLIMIELEQHPSKLMDQVPRSATDVKSMHAPFSCDTPPSFQALSDCRGNHVEMCAERAL